MSALATTSEVAGIFAGLVLPLGAATLWFARRWIDREIVTKLSNDKTPVAKYAHDARDYSKQALDVALETQKLIVNHVTDKSLHHVSE